jgi:hypothetical protein
MFSNTQKSALVILAGISLFSCSRTADKTPLQDAQVVLGPAQKDTNLQFAPISMAERKQALSIEGEIASNDFFRLSENLLVISAQQRNPEVEALSRKLMKNYLDLPTQRVSFSESLFTKTILGEGEPEVRKQLKIISREIDKATKGLANLLDSSQKGYPWPQKLNSFAETLESTDGYAVWFSNQVPKLGIDKDLVKPIQSAVKGEYSRFRPIVAGYMNDLQTSPRLSNSISTLEAALKEFQVTLPPPDQQELIKAKKIAKKIDEVQSSQDALTLIVAVWRISSPADRELIFKAKVPELYDYLKDKDEASLDCLASSFCLNPIISVPKRLAILPRLSEYGVFKIRDEVDTAAKAELIKTVLNAFVGFLPTLPSFVKEQMLAEIGKYKKQIAVIEKDFEGFAKTRIQNWANANFKAPLRGFEASRIHLSLNDSANLKLANLDKPGKIIVSDPKTIGANLAIAQQFLPDASAGKHALRAALVEPIIKMLAITGFRKPGGGIFPSAMLALDGEPEQLFNIANLLQGRTSFAVPNSFAANATSLIMDRKTAKRNSSVSAQAELLRGFSQQIAFHRDWEKNLFDETLGEVKIEQVVPEVPRGAIDYSLFPKEIMFTLAVGGSGAILQNIIRDLSPAFLLLDKGEILWGNDYEKISDGKISTVAAMVDIVDGKRGNQVRTADIANFILALDAFLEATEGMEKTNSPILRAVDSNGKSVLEQIEDARRYLRLFQMGLTNFLVYVAQNKDGSFASVFHLDKNLAKESDTVLLVDQALAIRALNTTAKRLNLPIFRWAALDGFYFLNRKMWDSKRQFYSRAASEKTGAAFGITNALDMIEVIRNLEDSAEILPLSSRQQWEKVARPWVHALGDL